MSKPTMINQACDNYHDLERLLLYSQHSITPIKHD